MCLSLLIINFHLLDNFSKSLGITKTGFWGVFGTGQAILFVFTAAFTGASHFSRSPLIKTLFTFSTIVAGYFLFSFLLYRGLNLKEYHPTDTQHIHFQRQDITDVCTCRDCDQSLHYWLLPGSD